MTNWYSGSPVNRDTSFAGSKDRQCCLTISSVIVISLIKKHLAPPELVYMEFTGEGLYQMFCSESPGVQGLYLSIVLGGPCRKLSINEVFYLLAMLLVYPKPLFLLWLQQCLLPCPIYPLLLLGLAQEPQSKPITLLTLPQLLLSAFWYLRMQFCSTCLRHYLQGWHWHCQARSLPICLPPLQPSNSLAVSTGHTVLVSVELIRCTDSTL